jgi:hypothetical protein
MKRQTISLLTTLLLTFSTQASIKPLNQKYLKDNIEQTCQEPYEYNIQLIHFEPEKQKVTFLDCPTNGWNFYMERTNTGPKIGYTIPPITQTRLIIEYLKQNQKTVIKENYPADNWKLKIRDTNNDKIPNNFELIAPNEKIIELIKEYSEMVEQITTSN